MNPTFEDRRQVGRLLAAQVILSVKEKENSIILALPRGGVPVGFEMSQALNVPLEVLIVRKIGHPIQSELAVGAVCEDEEPIWSEEILSRTGLRPDDLISILKKEKNKIRQQIETFREGRRLPSLTKKVVIIVDDGLATGATMLAAVKYLNKKGVAKIVVAVPVGAGSSARHLRNEIDELIILEKREDLVSVGQWYNDFSQVSDQEVVELLKMNQKRNTNKTISDLKIPVDQVIFEDHLESPKFKFQSHQMTLDEAIEKEMIGVKSESDFDRLIDSIKDTRVVMLGEASHGTEEFYEIRSLISERLIKEHGFKFIAVEGDWPDAYRLNKYIQGGEGKNAQSVLMQNHRWPTWMWANEQIGKLAEWMKAGHAGFYGLDVYSLFQSMDEVVNYLKKNDLTLAQEVQRRYACFNPFESDEIAYAKSLLKYPAGCEKEVLLNLQKILELRMHDVSQDGDELFSSQQNAHTIVNAESYYRATDMKDAGYVNLGGLARQSYGDENVALIGFGTYHGEVLAGSGWGRPEQAMPLPAAREDSYEYHFHQAAKKHKLNQFYLLLEDKTHSPFAHRLGHRGIGVVYDPRQESRGNYVPTELSKRYDAFIFVDKTHALKSLHAVFVRGEFPETWPSGQ